MFISKSELVKLFYIQLWFNIFNFDQIILNSNYDILDDYQFSQFQGINVSFLKGVFAKNERGYRLNAIKKRF